MKNQLFINGKPVDINSKKGKRTFLCVDIIFLIVVVGIIVLLTFLSADVYTNTKIRNSGTQTFAVVESCTYHRGSEDEDEYYIINYSFEMPSGDEMITKKGTAKLDRGYRVGSYISIMYDQSGRSIATNAYSVYLFQNLGGILIGYIVCLIFLVVLVASIIDIIIKSKIMKCLYGGIGEIVPAMFIGMDYSNFGNVAIKYSFEDKKGKTREAKTDYKYTERQANDISRNANLRVRHYKGHSILLDDSEELENADKNQTLCAYCGSKYDNKHKKCPNCGAKN